MECAGGVPGAGAVETQGDSEQRRAGEGAHGVRRRCARCWSCGNARRQRTTSRGGRSSWSAQEVCQVLELWKRKETANNVARGKETMECAGGVPGAGAVETQGDSEQRRAGEGDHGVR